MERELRKRNRCFRVIQSVWGLIGSICLIYSVCSPFWFQGKGLWTDPGITSRQAGDNETSGTEGPLRTATKSVDYSAIEAERVFGVLAVIMAVSSVFMCLLFIFCWSSNKHTFSKLNPGLRLYPGTLLITVLVPTGFFFLVSWSVFTRQHKDQLKSDISQFGSSYWLGAVAWICLIVILPATYVIDQFTSPEEILLQNI
ncbi:uncharacterized protein SI:CH211-256A21.4 [Latimeria chalumnae]|uniref:uncharacterized protein SI:CH211-256A21.4 n=1 Tax=Latimeria chalumnae TaxID=7897 RepID=UPI0006D92133|nr:PREDICTED: uncharacterized protein LOC106703376 [Latimeria chalumnae]XP_014343580.1 PREDICTED: uncharacterized protein LOC106703376 [Latimeria chalumnae]|eukprot:XP_014343573.1 PREDICTED: uncharacterized protein LOC106703376 [Latimeria chalumnae]